MFNPKIRKISGVMKRMSIGLIAAALFVVTGITVEGSSHREARPSAGSPGPSRASSRAP
jgi:hypothetical protein